MLAYDVPISALLFILDNGVPQEYVFGPTQEEFRARMDHIRSILENEDDGL